MIPQVEGRGRSLCLRGREGVCLEHLPQQVQEGDRGSPSLDLTGRSQSSRRRPVASPLWSEAKTDGAFYLFPPKFQTLSHTHTQRKALGRVPSRFRCNDF